MSDNVPDTTLMDAYEARLADFTLQIESNDREFIREVMQLELDGVEFKEFLKKGQDWLPEIRAYLAVGKDLAVLIAAVYHIAKQRNDMRGKTTKAKIRAKKISPGVRLILKELASLMDVETDEDVSSDDAEDEE